MELVGHYPRGSKPLRGPFSQFACGDSIAWFDEHGLTLVEESDGRMFPQQNRSEAVVECLRRAALAAGVKIKCGSAVRQLSCSEGGEFQIKSGRENYIPPEQETGNLLFFPSYLVHRVTLVTKGTRLVIVGWVHGNSFA